MTSPRTVEWPLLRLLGEIRKLEIDNLSPIQALQELYRLRQQLTDRPHSD